MSAVDQTLVVQPILPATALVLCDAPFLHTLSQVEREVAHLKVADDASAQSAANLQQRLTTAGRKLEEARESLKRPFIAKGREIDDAARAPAKRIEDAKNLIKAALTAFRDEQLRIAAEAERARQAELRRLEAELVKERVAALAKQEELQRLAREAAERNKAPVVDMEFEDEEPAPPVEVPKTEIEKRLDEVKYAPAVSVAKVAGISYRVRLLHRVENVAELPDAFLIKTPNDAAIRSVFCAQWKEGEPIPVLPGVKFEVERTSVSTGKTVF